MAEIEASWDGVALTLEASRLAQSSTDGYCRLMAAGLRKTQPVASTSGIAARRLGGGEIHRLDVSFTLGGVNVCPCHLSCFELAPAVPDYLYALATLYAQQQRWPRALACAEELVRMRPADEQLRRFLVQVRRMAKP